MSGVTTATPLAATCRASRTSRGSSIPDGCSPDVKSATRRRDRFGSYTRARIPPARVGIVMSRVAIATVSNRASRSAVPPISAARMTNDNPCA